MEGHISSFCKSLTSFLSHVESTIDSLTQSIQSPTIPIGKTIPRSMIYLSIYIPSRWQHSHHFLPDSVTSSFLRKINSRTFTVGESFERLESMALGTVSSEELLGHCNEVYKMHQMHIRDLEEFLGDYGYVPPPSPPPGILFPFF